MRNPPDQQPKPNRTDRRKAKLVSIDWYGDESFDKRKNDDQDHRIGQQQRIFSIFGICASLAIMVIGIAIITSVLSDPLQGMGRTMLTQSVPTIVASTRLPMTSFPTPVGGSNGSRAATSTPWPTPAPGIPMITELDGARYVRDLMVHNVRPGYVLRGLRFADNGSLWAAYNGNTNSSTPRCLPDEAFLQFDIGRGEVARWTFKEMVGPRAIAFGESGTAFALAWYTADCKTFVQALFAIADGAIIAVYPFETLSADDLIVADDGRIFVALGGFAGGASQKHLIALDWDAQTRRFNQLDDYAPDAYDARYQGLIDTQSKIYMVRVRSGDRCSLVAIDLPPSKATPTQWSPGIVTRIAPLYKTCPVALARRADGMLVGLAPGNNALAVISPTTGETGEYAVMSSGRMTGFAISPSTGHAFIAGARTYDPTAQTVATTQP